MVLFTKGNTFYLDRPASDPPEPGDPVTLGLPTRYWETKWLDTGDPDSKKVGRYLDVVTTKTSGSMKVLAYLDYSTTGESLQPALAAADSTINMANETVARFSLTKFAFRHIKLRFESSDPFEIVQLVLRVSDADPT